MKDEFRSSSETAHEKRKVIENSVCRGTRGAIVRPAAALSFRFRTDFRPGRSKTCRWYGHDNIGGSDRPCRNGLQLKSLACPGRTTVDPPVRGIHAAVHGHCS